MPSDPNPENLPLILVGASVRAAAWSASRAGMRPICLDMFADADLCRNAEASRLEKYPADILQALADAPPGPVLLTGALENHLGIVAALEQSRELWGCGAAAMRQARDPAVIHAVLTRAGLPCPSLGPPDSAHKWLLKPRHGAAGIGITAFNGQALDADHYLQRFIEGVPCSAIFLAHRDGSARLLGATEQIIAAPWLGAGPYRYAGSVGPLSLSPRMQAQLRDMGQVLTRSFGLFGLFGVDFISQDEIAWPIEINPRYTASVEIVERATGASALARLAAAARGDKCSEMGAASTQWGKAILFARLSFPLPREGPWLDSLAHFWRENELPDFADIPFAGTRFEAGQPILTLFASGASNESCLEKLRRDARRVEEIIYGEN